MRAKQLYLVHVKGEYTDEKVYCAVDSFSDLPSIISERYQGGSRKAIHGAELISETVLVEENQ